MSLWKPGRRRHTDVDPAVLTPCAGLLRPLSQTPDPVFAAEMLGAGAAVEPAPAVTMARSPVSGTVLVSRRHAATIVRADGVGVLLHLGIDTADLTADLESLVAVGDIVSAGQPLIRWDPVEIARQDRCAWALVCVLDTPRGAVTPTVGPVGDGAPLFSWPPPGSTASRRRESAR